MNNKLHDKTYKQLVKRSHELLHAFNVLDNRDIESVEVLKFKIDGLTRVYITVNEKHCLVSTSIYELFDYDTLRVSSLEELHSLENEVIFNRQLKENSKIREQAEKVLKRVTGQEIALIRVYRVKDNNGTIQKRIYILTGITGSDSEVLRMTTEGQLLQSNYFRFKEDSKNDLSIYKEHNTYKKGFNYWNY